MSTPLIAEVVRGLTEIEAQARREQGLGYAPPPTTGRTYGRIIRENVFSFINNVLFLLGIALVLVGRPTDAAMSVGIIAINVIVSLAQEIRAKRALDRIALLTRPRATVLRDGREREALPEELVIGDALRVGPGDQVLVDGRVLAGAMQLDESLLTGESDLVAKAPGDAVYSGTFCAGGGGWFEAERVGAASTAGQLMAGAKAHRWVLTPLQQEINFVTRAILVVVVYLELLIFANGLINAVPLAQGVQQATVVAGLVPNGLFVAIAVAYALAAVRIVGFGALVQQANAVESLSTVDVLCLDKTGTLTANRLVVEAVQPIGMGQTQLVSALAAIAASATVRNKTIDAIAAAYPADPRRLAGEAPFSSERKWSAVVFAGDDAPAPAPAGLYALGAMEMLRPFLAEGDGGDGPAWDRIEDQAASWSAAGLRVLLLAHHPEPPAPCAQECSLPGGMRPAGLVCLRDELRPEARQALAGFARNGVKLKIISGDSPDTVSALVRQAGLEAGTLVSGLDLAGKDNAGFESAASTATIFGRITPRQKEQLVDALRRRGHRVAMIGDGVNDVLSMKKAHLAVAMESGTQAARGVADIVLLRDSFAALDPALAEGQRIVNSMQDILKLFLARNASLALLIISSLIVGVFPINLRHASLLAFLSVGVPALLLAVWARPGRRQPGSLAGRLAHFVIPSSLTSSLLGLAVFYVPLVLRLAGLPRGAISQSSPEFTAAILSGQTALTAFLVIVGLLLVVFAEPPRRWWVGGDGYSGDVRPSWLAGGLAAVFLIVMAVSPLRELFDLTVLAALEWVVVGVAAAVWLFVTRWIWRRRLLERTFGIGRA